MGCVLCNYGNMFETSFKDWRSYIIIPWCFLKMLQQAHCDDERVESQREECFRHHQLLSEISRLTFVAVGRPTLSQPFIMNKMLIGCRQTQ